MGAAEELVIRRVADQHAEVLTLRAALDAEVARLYGDVPAFATASAHDAPQQGDSMLLALEGDIAVGLAGLRPLDARIAEVKHVYVVPAARRRGIASRLLEELEARARERGYERLRLDTGARQREAIALYRARGFDEIPAYNTNVNVDVWMEKRLEA